MKSLLFLAVLLSGLPTAGSRAQPAPAPAALKITLADGRVLPVNTVRRSKDTLLVTVALAAGVRSETGYPIATIRKIEMPEPAQIKSARALLAQGKFAEAFAQIHPIVLVQGDLSQIPGNYWAPAALLEVDALLALKRDRDAENLINKLTESSKDNALLLGARMALATMWLRSGKGAQAVPVFDEAIAASKSPSVLARAWTGRGDALLSEHDYDGALLAYLRIPVLYSNETAYLPPALLGSARAYEGLGDYEHARSALEELSRDFATTPEAAQSKTDLARIDQKLNPVAN